MSNKIKPRTKTVSMPKPLVDACRILARENYQSAPSFVARRLVKSFSEAELELLARLTNQENEQLTVEVKE